MDDWEFVTKERQVVPLPRELTVSDLLDMYRSKNAPKKKTNAAGSDAASQSADADIFNEVISGIKLYFEHALGTILLYRLERKQYMSIKEKFPEKSLCDIYGPEHLLRLFVSFPALIAQTNMDQQSISILREHLDDLLSFMVENKNKIFLKEYENISPQNEAVSRAF